MGEAGNLVEKLKPGIRAVRPSYLPTMCVCLPPSRTLDDDTYQCPPTTAGDTLAKSSPIARARYHFNWILYREMYLLQFDESESTREKKGLEPSRGNK